MTRFTTAILIVALLVFSGVVWAQINLDPEGGKKVEPVTPGGQGQMRTMPRMPEMGRMRTIDDEGARRAPTPSITPPPQVNPNPTPPPPYYAGVRVLTIEEEANTPVMSAAAPPQCCRSARLLLL